jgi:hypothetical protein
LSFLFILQQPLSTAQFRHEFLSILRVLSRRILWSGRTSFDFKCLGEAPQAEASHQQLHELAHDLSNDRLPSTVKMDNLLPNLLSFPPHPPPPNPMSDHAYDSGIRDQIDYVKKLSDSKLLQQTSGGENVLDVSNYRSLPESVI